MEAVEKSKLAGVEQTIKRNRSEKVECCCTVGVGFNITTLDEAEAYEGERQEQTKQRRLIHDYEVEALCGAVEAVEKKKLKG